MIQQDFLQSILKDSNYSLSLFSAEEIKALRQKVFTKETRGRETTFINCVVRGKDIQLKPEEVVRQLHATKLIEQYGYPRKRLAFEYSVSFGREKKSVDIVIFDKDRTDTAYIIVELKKPKLKDKTSAVNWLKDQTGDNDAD